MLRQDGHGHVLQKRRVDGGQGKGHRVVVDDGDICHILVVGGVLGAVVGIHDGLIGELHILGGEGLAVVPGNALRQIEGIGQRVGVVIPALRQTGNDLSVAVVVGKAVEQQHIDLAVLVHGGVDAGIVAAAVHQRGAAALGVVPVGIVSAAGRQRQQHGKRQHQRGQSFHHGHGCDFLSLVVSVPSIADIPPPRKPGGGI